MSISERDRREMLELGERDLVALAGSRLLLTGGTGYVGKWLLEALVVANHKRKLRISVVVPSRDPSRLLREWPHLFNNDCVSLVRSDIRRFAPNDPSFSHIIHGATDVVASVKPTESLDVMFFGTQRILDLARKTSAERILLLSSGSVYGEVANRSRALVESSPTVLTADSRKDAYALGKLVSEMLLLESVKTMSTAPLIARIFAQFGPYMTLDSHYAVANFLRDVRSGSDIRVRGDGRARRSLMYGVDLVTWLLRVLVRGEPEQIYNVGSSTSMSILEIAETIQSAVGTAGQRVKVEDLIPSDSRTGMYVPDTTKARSELSLHESVDFQEGLRRTMEWLDRRAS